ncbi:MAG: ATP-dependent 6-phosphofructokinase [Desulfobulbaceae bacterium]|nr:ATP-dependent 6-phosphofructokinase [Desulfobulbaceae bacterium]
MNVSDMQIEKIGKCKINNPMHQSFFIDENDRILFTSQLKELKPYIEVCGEIPSFEMAGPRKRIYFDPSKICCGIVTCGGLCPGTNDVIRAIVMSLYHHYGVRTIWGFRYGFEGLSPQYGHVPVALTPDVVREIHNQGGTILGSSRGPQDVSSMVDTLEQMHISTLYTIGGDGTMRGATAICEEINRRGLKVNIIGVPKTIDNDISYIDMSFGYITAVEASNTSTYTAYVEATGARNGIGLVKLMGRESGFIAASASLANNVVNFCLVPEVDFSLEGFLNALKKRITRRGYAVIVVGEGAGQNLMIDDRKKMGTDPSGNLKLGDIGLFLKQKICEFFDKEKVDITLKYIDPSYTIRSEPANAYDSAFCLLLGYNAVHAGMTGRTNMFIGHSNNQFTHVPIPLAAYERKKIDPLGRMWEDVISCTGQPENMVTCHLKEADN